MRARHFWNASATTTTHTHTHAILCRCRWVFLEKVFSQRRLITIRWIFGIAEDSGSECSGANGLRRLRVFSVWIVVWCVFWMNNCCGLCVVGVRLIWCGFVWSLVVWSSCGKNCVRVFVIEFSELNFLRLFNSKIKINLNNSPLKIEQHKHW